MEQVIEATAASFSHRLEELITSKREQSFNREKEKERQAARRFFYSQRSKNVIGANAFGCAVGVLPRRIDAEGKPLFPR